MVITISVLPFFSTYCQVYVTGHVNQNNNLEDENFLKELDLSFWGTAKHKVSPTQFFEQLQIEDTVLLDLRSPEEIGFLALPFALHIPIHELPDRWKEIPTDRLVATF